MPLNFSIDENCYSVEVGEWKHIYIPPVFTAHNNKMIKRDECIPPQQFITLSNGCIHYLGDTAGFEGPGDDGNTYKAYDDTMFRDMIDRFNQGEDISRELDSACTTLVTSMDSLFFDPINGNDKNVGGLEFNYPQVSKWDVQNVIGEPLDMSDFHNFESGFNFTFTYSQFNQDISGWDVSNAKTMYGTVAISPFDQDLSGWDVSNVETPFYFAYNAPICGTSKMPNFSVDTQDGC